MAGDRLPGIVVGIVDQLLDLSQHRLGPRPLPDLQVAPRDARQHVQADDEDRGEAGSRCREYGEQTFALDDGELLWTLGDGSARPPASSELEPAMAGSGTITFTIVPEDE